LCDRWFCERHIDPRLAFIKDLNAPPEVRALHYTEMQREDGHPDFAYSQIKFLELDIEEKNRNELIRQALDRMNHYYDNALIPEKPIDAEEGRKKRIEMPLKEEEEIKKKEQSEKWKEESGLNEPRKEDAKSSETITTGNFYGHRFVVPREVYSNAEYREYLNYAKTMKSVRDIVDEYYRKYPMRKDLEKPKKKKHWWQH
jgi:hypothetical protein